MSYGNYQTGQKITIIDSTAQANSLTSEFIAAQTVLGVDCEWNSVSGSKISLIQIATCSNVFLFRICKLEGRTVPDCLVDVLQNMSIIKVGVNIENDAKLLRKQYNCTLKGWVDLRHLTVDRESYGRVLVKKLKKFEEELALLYREDHEDEVMNMESKRTKKIKRYSWSPKLGLGSLAEDCLGLRLLKTSSTRWQSDWEAEELSVEQVDYAAADGAAGLDVFFALCLREELGSPINISDINVTPELEVQLSQFCSRVVERPVKQKTVEKQCFSLVTSVNKEFDLTDYLKKSVKNNQSKPPDKRAKLAAGKVIGKPKDSSDFYCQDKANKCCCCAKTEKLVKKNVIPREYRKHLPAEFKDRQSHDIVLLCVQCHCSSNIFDNMMREQLASEYDVPVNYKNQFLVVNRMKSSVRAAAKALTATNNIIPEERKKVLKQTITDWLGHEPSLEEIAELKYIAPNDLTCRGEPSDHGTEVVKKVIDAGHVEQFIVKWRNFFLSSMKPEFLPVGWSVDHRTRDKSREQEQGSADNCEATKESMTVEENVVEENVVEENVTVLDSV